VSELVVSAGLEERLAHLRTNELAAFLDGGLSALERDRVVAHIDVCNVCRAELVEIGRAIEPDRRKDPSRTLRGRWRIPSAMAAGIVAILLIPRLTDRTRSTTDATRAARVAPGEGQRRMDLVSPTDDVTVPVARVAFKWHAVPADVYRIAILTASGDSIWSAETTDTTAVPPPTIEMRAGQAYFWRVDAIANGIVATTGVHRLQISR